MSGYSSGDLVLTNLSGLRSVFLLSVLMLCGCSSSEQREESAKVILNREGIADVMITKRDTLVGLQFVTRCGKGSEVRFEGKDRSGKRVVGSVCNAETTFNFWPFAAEIKID